MAAKRMGLWLGCWLALTAVGPGAGAADVAWEVGTILKRVTQLKHDAAGRWPMITWEHFTTNAADRSYDRGVPLPEAAYRELARRGLAETIRLNETYIPMAQTLQQWGFKVIAMEGAGGEGPGAEVPSALHPLPKDFKRAPGAPVHPCPLLLEGWHRRAMKVREILAKFKAANVTLDAAWLDWEEEPWWGREQWEQASACPRCRELFPAGVLDDFLVYRAFIARFHQQLYSTYLAAPILEAYPRCLVTDWGIVYSSPQVPTAHYWGGWPLPPSDAGLFTGLNPVAYGNDECYVRQWTNAWTNSAAVPLDEEHMDRLYTRVLLAQVSGNAANALLWAPEKPCIPWVCRYCPDVGDKKIPALSRERYRELLRHIWLRGADSMQIFNALRQGETITALQEVEDAVQIYDEALGFRPFLDKGQIMNTDIPPADYDGAIWSGLRLENEALVRAFTQGRRTAHFSLTPWAGGAAVELEAPPDGAYYRLVKAEGTVRVKKERF